MKKEKLPKISKEEKYEIANAITHGLGILLSLIAAIPLVSIGVQNWEWYHVAGLSTFCLSLLLVYTSSTIYHCVKKPYSKKLFRKIDHICIYILIGGTHTPFVLKYLNNNYGHYYLLTLWGLIILGVLYKIFLIEKWQWLSLAFYIFLGWMAIFIIPVMWNELPLIVFTWILTGGILYSLGTIFYSWKKLPYHHSIWHMFVLGGSIGHYIAMIYAYT